MKNEKLEMGKEKLTENRGQMAKTGCIIFLFSLLFSLFSFLACQHPFEPPKRGKPPVGMGWFLLAIDEVRMGRTVLPSEDLEDNFLWYKLEFFNVDDGSRVEPVPVIQLGDAIPIPIGTYDLWVTAYTKDGYEAAWGGSVGKIVIKEDEPVTGLVILEAFMEGGQGTFSWDITYPQNIATASMTVTRWPADGTPEQTLYFIGGTPATKIDWKDSLLLNAGIYRVVFSLVLDNSHSLEYRETVHIYTYMDSFLKHEFKAGHFTYIIVTHGNDDNTLGSLRKAIADAKKDEDSSIIIKGGVGTIFLKDRLEIDKSLTIEGNSVIIMRDPSWTEIEDDPQLLYIGDGKVTIRRVLFKDNKIYAPGAAIYNNADLTLESCIFSGNSNNNKVTPFVCHGGAVYSDKETTLSVMGCTFYKNIAGGGGGAIAVDPGAKLTFAGNLFYENSQNYGTVVFGNGRTITSNGYNAVDIQGTGGWDSSLPDKSINGVPISPENFKLRFGSEAAGVITSLPQDYPTADFYGYPIIAGAAAGAVQSFDDMEGFYILYDNDITGGTVSVWPQSPDNVYFGGLVEITATPMAGYRFEKWLVNGLDYGDGNPLRLTMTEDKNVKALFKKEDERQFWAIDTFGGSYYQLNAKLLAEGGHCTVWVEVGSDEKPAVTEDEAVKMAQIYDTDIYPKMISAFSMSNIVFDGKQYDNTMDFADRGLGDGDGKLCILLLDIRDSYFYGVNDAYVGGYFWEGNFYSNSFHSFSNECDMIYLDTYPGKPGSPESNRTLAHEMQHLMNFATTQVQRTGNMDLWINEGLSSAAEWVYAGHEGDTRLGWYNADQTGLISRGNNFFVWDNRSSDSSYAVLDDYATVYLFFQWLRLQSNGTDIYKTIIFSTSSDYNAVVNAMSGYNDWGTLLKTWLAANYIMAPTGSYGYKDDDYLSGIQTKTAPSGPISIVLYPGEGVYSLTNSAGSTPAPGDKIKYAGLNKTGQILNDNSVFAGGALLTYNVNTDQSRPPESGTTTGVGANLLPGSRFAGAVPMGPFAISAGDMLRRNGHKEEILPPLLPPIRR